MFEFLRNLFEFVRLHDVTLYKLDVDVFFKVITLTFCIITTISVICHVIDMLHAENFNILSFLINFSVVVTVTIISEFLFYCILIQLPIVFFCAWYLNFLILRVLEKLETVDTDRKTTIGKIVFNFATWTNKKLSFKSKNNDERLLSFKEKYTQKLNYTI